MKNFKGPGYHQSGVSMIEVLIAILISVIGLFSVTKMQLSAVSNTHSAYLRSQAAVSANAMVDQLRANSSAAISGDYDLALTASAPTSGGLEVASRVDEVISAKILTESGALEYRLRYSSLATRPLSSGVTFTEQSFRDSYMALSPIYDSQQGYAFDANTLMAQRNKLKQLMGHDDALKILANLDNRFAQFKAAGERYYLSEAQILAAYKIISDSEEQMIEGYFVRQTDSQQGIQMIRAAAQSREEKLAAYLGEDISRSLMRAFTSARPDPTTPAGILLSGN